MADLVTAQEREGQRVERARAELQRKEREQGRTVVATVRERRAGWQRRGGEGLESRSKPRERGTWRRSQGRKAERRRGRRWAGRREELAAERQLDRGIAAKVKGSVGWRRRGREELATLGQRRRRAGAARRTTQGGGGACKAGHREAGEGRRPRREEARERGELRGRVTAMARRGGAALPLQRRERLGGKKKKKKKKKVETIRLQFQQP